MSHGQNRLREKRDKDWSNPRLLLPLTHRIEPPLHVARVVPLLVVVVIGGDGEGEKTMK
jgi:hypothetical protein